MIFLEMKIRPDFNQNIVEQAAVTTLDMLKISGSDLTIVLTDDEEIRILNRDFLAQDSPTDVLSFPAGEMDPDTGRRYLGDVVVSMPRAADQALVRGHAVENEVQLLVIHGVLHLLGYEHSTKNDKVQMWQVQTQVLDKRGIKINVLEE